MRIVIIETDADLAEVLQACLQRSPAAPYYVIPAAELADRGARIVKAARKAAEVTAERAVDKKTADKVADAPEERKIGPMRRAIIEALKLAPSTNPELVRWLLNQKIPCDGKTVSKTLANMVRDKAVERGDDGRWSLV